MKVLKSKFYGTLGLLSLVVLSGCKNELSVSGANTPEAGTANGSGATAVASGQTSVTLTPASGKRWNSFHVDLGADYLDTNICSGKTVFGKPGSALCGSSAWTVTTLNLDSSNVGSLSGTTFTYTAAANNAHNVLNLNMGTDFTAANLCTGKSVLGVTGTTACVAGATITPAGAGDVLFGTEAWVSNGTKVTGTMPNRGTWNLTTAFPGAGYVSAVSNAPTAANIKAGVTILGVAGTATDHGAINLNTTALPGSAGFFSSIALTLAASDVCAGNSIFGSAGTAVCNSIFSDLTASNMHRNVATAQMTSTTEKTTSSYASGYREVPDVLKDDDGYYTTDQGCGSDCSPVVKASRPTVDCGTSGSITARIANCVTQNGASATWSGSTKGLSGEATWKLVTRKNGAEVWRDERTGLAWSDTDNNRPNWCYAAGNKQANDPSGYCNNPSYQDQTNPYSTCSEFTGAQPTFNGDDYSGGTYSDYKGGMGKLSATSVRWRLPTLTDYKQADIDGIRFVLPNMSNGFWSATVFSGYRDYAWNFGGYDGSLGSYNRYSTGSYTVRCVGR